MVELQGIEPWTSSMRTKRATNCATAPNPDRSVNMKKTTSAEGVLMTAARHPGWTDRHPDRNDSPISTGTRVETFSCAASGISSPNPSLISSCPEAHAANDAPTDRTTSR